MDKPGFIDADQAINLLEGDLAPRLQRPIKPLPPRLSESNDRKAFDGAVFVSSRSPTPPGEASVDGIVSQVLEIVPDISLEHLYDLVANYQKREVKDCAEHILHDLLENPNYPKSQRLGKRKREDSDARQDEETKEADTHSDFGRTDRAHTGGPLYQDLALTQLFIDFPFIPKPHIRKAFLDMKSFYAPTHMHLETERKKPNLPYRVKASKTKVAAKSVATDPLFLAERQWIDSWLLQDCIQRDAQAAAAMDKEENGGIDCSCCFSTSAFHEMIQCAEGHLFCPECMQKYAGNLLGSQNHKIVCIDQSGCQEEFPEAELERVLPEKLLLLYNRIKQRKEIAAAAIDGLEECPFCDFKIVIENEHEKLFRCHNDQCLAVTCRACKKPDHLPKSCKEMEDDRRLDGRHAVEEALSNALLRNCPKCNKSFIKEDGCNKMTCPECRTLSCYICREVINGYEHFDRQGGPSSSKRKCPLWDGVDKINEEIRAAGQKAAEEYKAVNPDVQDDEIAVEAPVLQARPHPHHGIQHAYVFPPLPVHHPRIHLDPNRPFAMAPLPHLAGNQGFGLNVNININNPGQDRVPQPHRQYYNANNALIARVQDPRMLEGRRQEMHINDYAGMDIDEGAIEEADDHNNPALERERPVLPPHRGRNRGGPPAAAVAAAPGDVAGVAVQAKRRRGVPARNEARPKWR